MSAFRVGQKVTVIGSRGEVVYFTEVTRVTSARVQTADGKRWDLRGEQYPRSKARFSAGLSIALRTSDHDAEVDAADNRYHARNALETLLTKLRRGEMDARTIVKLREALAPFEVKP